MSTIKDVARVSGLGVGTISRYLNGATVKRENEEKILSAIKILNYNINPIAKSMKTGKSMTIAMVVPTLANMFSMRVIESIESELEKYGYSVIVADCNADEKKQLSKITQLKNKLVDGFILMPIGDCAKKIKGIINDTPLVLIDRLFSENLFDSVVINNEEIAYKQAKQILSTGVKRIGIIKGPQSITTAKHRTQGYLRAIEEFEISDCYSIDGDYTYDSGYKAMKQLLNKQVEAVFISNYELTIGAINCLNEGESNVSLLGFDSLELSNLVKQPYSFISQPIEEIGRSAAQLLLSRMEDKDRAIHNQVIHVG